MGWGIRGANPDTHLYWLTMADCSTRPTALVVEDEESVRRVIVEYLRREGFTIVESGNGLEAVDLAASQMPDVVVLDLMLPGLDGVEVCRRLRTFTDAYIIMLTARAEEVDKLIGLSVGADDYLTKPFSPRELVARVHVMMRRPRGGSVAGPMPGHASTRRIASLTLNPDSREVWVGDRAVDLTRTEFDILDALSAQPGRVHSRRQIIDHVWGQNWVGDDRIVDVHIAHIRAKLDPAKSGHNFILTVRGVGFRIDSG